MLIPSCVGILEGCGFGEEYLKGVDLGFEDVDIFGEGFLNPLKVGNVLYCFSDDHCLHLRVSFCF